MNKINLISFILFSMLTVFACNTQSGKNQADDTTEVDNLPSDKIIMQHKDETGENDFEACEDLVKEILTTSQRYIELTKGLEKRILKNGGLSYGLSLERSPLPDKVKIGESSKTYDFTIFEVYVDRQLNTVRFSFNPDNKQLFEYDAVNDKLIPIEFDRMLLLKYDELCK
ncbi:MAG: hypothetical protein R6W78_16755 [Bacteroidales bacterium]